jgi:transposase
MQTEINPLVNEEDLALMKKLIAGKKLPAKYAIRLLTIINRVNKKTYSAIAEILHIGISSAKRYIKRYNEGGIEALLKDKTRKPGTPPISEEKKTELIKIVCTEKPVAATHWSVRALAKRLGIGKTSVNNILRENGLKPHVTQKFGFSSDEHFEEKLRDVVGLYMNPPDNALVICVDEKTQIQALERANPVLPMFRNVPERQTSDYIRHGTTTLFAALDVLNGTVIGECKDRHTSADYLEFLKKLNKECEKGKVLHIIADNYSTHKTKEVKEYVEKNNSRFVLHFTPTHSSWLNLVERWFGEITNKRIRRESWNNVKELINAIKEFIDNWNENGKPFVWHKTADNILSSIEKLKSGYSK